MCSILDPRKVLAGDIQAIREVSGGNAVHPELFRDAYLERIQSGFPDAYAESVTLADEIGISRLDALVVLAAEARM